MRKLFLRKFRKSLVALTLLSAVSMPSWAVNTKTTVQQVSTAVTLADDVDYIITGATPFVSGGEVNITNTEHAVIILDAVKPSRAISSWLRYIKINGEQAVNNRNCMVKLYNLGAIILPYAGGNNFKPLTVYSEKNFEGESCNEFGLENTGGYMNTLTEEKLNNRISSFKLKRGYMVTFSLKEGGRGYSRCFIAADKDIEMASLPGILDNSISSYRVFKWYDAGKKQLANDLTTSTLAALNVQSSYTWSQGHDMAPDYECVPNHIYEDYPSSAAIGQATWSPHTKNNNEPRNSADDHPQDLNTILNNWENMMRTGMRLCTPASWDGSDYVGNAGGFLAQFLDSIDARGWRCDIIDLHCYWAEGTFNSMHNWSDKYKRPIWISEWCWGASWNSNGAFASGVTETQVRDALERICTRMNGWDYVERYYYWNGERDPSRLYKNGSLTPAGQYYAGMNSGVGYNGKYDFVPKTPKQYDPSDLTVSFDKRSHVAVLSWKDYNGEMNASMSIMRRKTTATPWEKIATIDTEDDAATYVYADSAAVNGCEYRVQVVDAANKERYTNIVMAASDDLEAGDAIDMDGVTKYVGGNLYANGDFNMGLLGWKSGTGEQLAAPYFQVVPLGGNGNGAYLQAYGNGAAATATAVSTSVEVKPYTNYYFSVATCNMPSGYSNRLGLTDEGKASTSPKVYINNTTGNWVTQFGSFNSEEHTRARLVLYNLAAKAQVDQLLLCQLFSTKDSAVADGIEKARREAELFIQFNTKTEGKYAGLNTELSQVLASVTTTDEAALLKLRRAIDAAVAAYKILVNADQTQLFSYTEKLVGLKLYDVKTLESLQTAAVQATAAADICESYPALQVANEIYLNATELEGTIQNPSFANVTGWNVKSGTYTGGDQRINSKDDVTFWNAWWSGIGADDLTKTMAIKQDVSKLNHGLYALECKAATEHFCLSDQHGYIVGGEQREETARLSADYYDLPSVSQEDRWQTLTTSPIYVDDNSSLTIGFEGSKQGATDGAWLKWGDATAKNDKREGWWCATDFVLRFTPLYRLTVEPSQWGAICLPYAIRSSETLKLYQIVGINADYTQLCLEEIEETEAGMPCLYRSTEAVAQFLEYGEAVTRASDGAGNLRGFLLQSARVPLNYYYISEGGFVKLTSSENRPSIGNYTGIIRPFTDNGSKAVPVLSDWTGLTMPISGVTDEEKAKNAERIETAIKLPYATVQQPDGIYTIAGRMLSDDNLKPGLYIKVVGGRAYKTIVK